MSVLTTSQNAANVFQLGGGKAWFRQANADGSIANSDTWGISPYIKASSLKDDTPTKEFETEDGQFLYSDGSRKITVEATWLDRSVDALSFMASIARGNFFSMLKQISVDKIGGTNGNGVYQYIYFPILKPVSTMEFSSQGNEVKVTFMAIKPTSTITNSNWTGVSGQISAAITSSTPTITVNPTTSTRLNCQYYSWYEALS